MNSAPVESAFAIDLDGSRSHRLIEQALRLRAPISLWPSTWSDERSLTGPLIGRTDEGLLVQLDLERSAPGIPLVSEYCEASFRIEDARLMFSTYVLDVSEPRRRLEIAQPDALQVIQRRRYQRRELRSSIPVRISGDALAGGPPVTATLLNVGTGGLACRCERAAAAPLEIDAAVDLQFSLPEDDRPFELAGRVRGKASAAGREQILLSVEFDAAEYAEAMERLSEILYGSMPAYSRG